MPCSQQSHPLSPPYPVAKLPVPGLSHHQQGRATAPGLLSSLVFAHCLPCQHSVDIWGWGGGDRARGSSKTCRGKEHPPQKSCSWAGSIPSPVTLWHSPFCARIHRQAPTQPWEWGIIIPVFPKTCKTHSKPSVPQLVLWFCAACEQGKHRRG